MRTSLPGIAGSLFPGRYLSDRLLLDAGATDARARDHARLRLRRWWQQVSASCGPVSGPRALFDLAAMPLAAALGFRASDASFAARMAQARLVPRAGADGPPVALLVAPWAHRTPAIWRDAVLVARPMGAEWCVIMAPPHMQIVDTTTGSRRGIEVRFPDVIEDAASFERFWAVAHADAFLSTPRHRSTLARLIERADAFQDSVRDDLQRGVADSLTVLDRIIVPRTRAPEHRQRESLAIVYRILFLLFAESRELVPWRHPLYGPAYSVSIMCDTARRNRDAAGLWPGLAAVSRLLRIGCRTPELDVRPFNGHLFSRAAAPALERHGRAGRSHRATAEDRAIADTLINLSSRPGRGGRETIAYPDLGVEQLGSVYEHVLGHPHRKQSGSFYTPRALTELVVRCALTPLTRHASSDAILDLRVVDPAMGSGAFLVAACRHLARAYERALLAEGRLHEHEIDTEMRADFRRLIALRCLYGVDRNPVAVQLARLSLWLATLASGKPLTFLDHRLRTGDALIGARPSDLRLVTPRRRHAVLPLFDDGFAEDAASLTGPLASLASEPDDAIDVVRRKEAQWARMNRDDSTLARWRLAAHVWCARWFAPRGATTSDAETRAAIDALTRGDGTLPSSVLSRRVRQAREAAEQHRFFHWPLEFADAFYDTDGGPRAAPGFDAVIGNPPWEMLRADHGAQRDTAHVTRFIRESGLYEASGRGHVNLYQPFVERALDLARTGGQIGLVLPWGLASDDGAAELRARLLDRCRVSTLIGLDNAGGIFDVHRGVRFLAVVASPGGRTDELPMIGGVSSLREIERLCHDDREQPDARRISRGTLSASGGAQRRIPDVRRDGDVALLDHVCGRWPALGSASGWRVEFGRELNVTDDRDAFGDRGLPVIEGKHIQPFVTDVTAPRHRITEAAARAALPSRAFEHARLAYRDVSAVSNRQSLIAAVIPAKVVTTHTLFCLKTQLDLDAQHFLCACFNSYVLNAVVRLLMGGHLTTSLVESLPVPPWTGSRRQRRIAALTRRLSSRGPHSGVSGRVQGLVAAEYGVDGPTFDDILRRFPLVPEAERDLARNSLRNILMRG